METPQEQKLLEPARFPVSVVLPTYNESQNIVRVIDSIAEVIPEDTKAEIVVVDDNSPDGTSGVVIDHVGRLGQEIKKRLRVQVINRPYKQGLSSAILAGVNYACGDIVVVMDSDMSHPPQTIPSMLHEINRSRCDIVVASRYIKGGGVSGWPFRRKMISKGATKIARHILDIKIKDPMSGFFAFRRHLIKGINFDGIGYKMLLEMLVKVKDAKIKEIPYTFTNRRFGSSKLDTSTMVDYIRAVWQLYRYGKDAPVERRKSVRFLSKAARFYTVGASGLLINYFVSFVLTALFPAVWYLHANMVGIMLSITSNFILNKLWTFEDRDLSVKRTFFQYGLFAGFSVFGALVQLSIVYYLVENQGQDYPLALVLAVASASVSNFLLNKKWTFGEKIWG